jgi:hypothetical protein
VADRIARYPYLYPQEMPVGVTAFFVPGAGGKDLDNIFRQLVVPVLFEHLQLPRLRRHPCRTPKGDAPGTDTTAISHRVRRRCCPQRVPRPPGSVVIAFADGKRQELVAHGSGSGPTIRAHIELAANAARKRA